MSLLDDVMIAAPCNLAWDEMPGDERVRHCRHCNKNVYNISSMTKLEAEQFLQKNGTSECLRIYRRADGTILTDNCPVGLRKLRDKARTILRITAAIFSNIIAVTCVFAQQSTTSTSSSSSSSSSVSSGSWQTPLQSRDCEEKDPPNDLPKNVAWPNPKWNVTNTPWRGQTAKSAMYNGFGFIRPRPPKKGTTILGTDECSSTAVPSAQLGPPRVYVGKPRRDPSPVQTHRARGADESAVTLYGQAKRAEQKGDLFVAFALYQDAISASMKNPRTDPLFFKTLESSFLNLKSRIQNQVLVIPDTGEQVQPVPESAPTAHSEQPVE
jgi:hypothetical protein